MKPEEVERSFSAGQSILEHGATTRELYVVRSGSVCIDAGDGRPVRRLVGGEVFGEISAILGRGSPYAATADEDAVVLVLDLPLINRLCRESPEFSMRLMRHLADEWSREIDLAYGAREVPQALSRLAAVLLRRHAAAEGGALTTGLRELADDAGLTMFQAYQALHDLLERGWAQLSDDQLALVEPEALEALIG